MHALYSRYLLVPSCLKKSVNAFVRIVAAPHQPGSPDCCFWLPPHVYLYIVDLVITTHQKDVPRCRATIFSCEHYLIFNMKHAFDRALRIWRAIEEDNESRKRWTALDGDTIEELCEQHDKIEMDERRNRRLAVRHQNRYMEKTFGRENVQRERAERRRIKKTFS